MITATIPNDNKWAYKRNNGVQPVADDVLVDVLIESKHYIGVKAGCVGWPLENGGSQVISWRLHVEEKEFPEESRIDAIGQNGNDGLHYSELDAPDNNVDKVSDSASRKQERYTNDEGQDLIDEWATKLTHAEYRTVMFAMIEKYNRRLGKKAPIHQETAKMQDYMQRWHEYEVIWSGE